jgi:CheY-like chemotaxis protein
MLGDLADLSSLKAGRLILDSHPFDLRALLADAVTAWAAKARGRNIQLRVEGAASLPRHMRGDPRRLRRTLDTLIAHAVRECEQGLVTLHAVAAQLETDERREFDDRDWLVRFSVSGAGASRREPQGSTLGLSVGRELARLMGGDLHRGTSDGDDLFVLEVALGAARTQPGQAPVQPQVNLRALIVDDHEMNRRALALMLEPHGVRLSSASSALGALEILASAPFDVVLMDVDIPLMDGREACRRLRGSPGVNQLTPVIACMTSADEAEWRACRMAGMNARVVKPIDAPALYLAIEQALREQRGGRRSAAA